MRLSLVAVALLALWLGACRAPAPEMKPYSNPALGFSVSFPTPPKVTDEPASAGGSPHTVTVEADAGGREFAVSVTDAPDPSRDIGSVTAAASDAIARGVGGQAGVPTYAATSDGVIGRELVISKDGRPAAKARFFLAGGRFYVLAANASGGIDDPSVDDFLTSFRVIAGPPASNSAPANSPG